MKSGWPIKRLGDACTIRPPKSEARHRLQTDSLVSFAGMEDLGTDRKFLKPTQTRPFASVNGTYTYFADGDVLLAKITPCFENGKLGIAAELNNGVGFGSSEFIVFRPGPDLYNEFLYYYLARPEFRTEGETRMGGAVGQQRVSKDFIENYPVPIPPISEQRRMVAILDKAFAAIATAKANTEKNLQNARALFSSRLESVFTLTRPDWPSNPLHELTSKIGSGATPLGGERVYSPEGIPFIRSLNVHDDGFRHDGLAFLNQSQAAELDNVAVTHGDVLLNITGASIARCCVVPEDVTPARVNQHVSIVRPIPEELDSEFLRYLLISKPYKTRLLNAGEDAGATRQALTKGGIGRFTISIPSTIDEQRSIASELCQFWSRTRNLEASCQRKLAAFDELKRSVLNAAFTGEL